MEAESPFYTKKQGVAGAALASTMHSIASAVPPPAAASTNEAAAKVNRLRVRLGPGPVTAALATMASAAPAAAVMSTDEAAAKPAYLARMEAESRFYPKKQGVTGTAQASAVASMASSGSLSAATSTNEATAKAAYLARMEAESPFYTKKQVVAGATLASTMRSIASMASAMPLPAATSTDEAAAKAACLARMQAESPFYTKKQGVVGAALASTMRSIASMASAMPLPAATSTDEQLPKPLVLLERKRSRLSTRRSK